MAAAMTQGKKKTSKAISTVKGTLLSDKVFRTLDWSAIKRVRTQETK